MKTLLNWKGFVLNQCLQDPWFGSVGDELPGIVRGPTAPFVVNSEIRGSEERNR